MNSIQRSDMAVIGTWRDNIRTDEALAKKWFAKHGMNELVNDVVARCPAKAIQIKEIKLRPQIDIHDYDVKARAMTRFFEEGDKVKVTLRFRGREMAHPELGMKLLQRVKADFEPVAKVEYEPRMEGRQMLMVIAPK